MIRKKICMLGAFSVGKTSLVRQFVESLFSERYQTTVGVKIDKKVVAIEGSEVTLLLWDLHGEDEFQEVRESYLRGSSGYLLVADGTRPATLDVARGLDQRARAALGQETPRILLVNKRDLESEWSPSADAAVAAWQSAGAQALMTSAKSGDGVEDAFLEITRRMLAL